MTQKDDDLLAVLRMLDYDVKSYEIRPPIGYHFRWGAKLVVYSQSHRSVLDRAGAPVWQEWLGATEDEARQKARSAMEGWLDRARGGGSQD